MSKLKTIHGKRISIAQGFGSSRYKLSIATAIGENITLAFTASGDGQALALVNAMLRVMANPNRLDTVDRQLELLRSNIGQDGIDELIAIGLEFIDPPAIEDDLRQKAIGKLAALLAHTRRQTNAIANRNAKKLAQDILPQIQPQHFVATLYTPSGKGLFNFSNFTAIEGEYNWQSSKFA